MAVSTGRRGGGERWNGPDGTGCSRFRRAAVCVPGSVDTVGFDDVVSLGVPEQGDTTAFIALLGDLPTMPLREGVAETIESFRSLLARGLVEPQLA